MKVIQNFSSKKHILEYPKVDILIWYVGLLQLKKFGHSLKLYCEKKDLDFLKQWGLLDFYDEIDTEVLAKFKPNINETNFWSVRKLECIRHEFEVSAEKFAYIDTDIIVNRSLEFEDDILVWGPEDNRSGVYLDWKHLSLPKDYILEDWLKNTLAGFNCGILAFKSKEVFNTYLEEYYKFTVDNPCTLKMINLPSENQRNSWACTAEQRILKGICVKLNLSIEAFMDEVGIGSCENGIHYFIFRHYWRELKNKYFYGPEKDFAINSLNTHVKVCFKYLDERGKEIFLQIPEFNYLYFENKLLNKYI